MPVPSTTVMMRSSITFDSELAAAPMPFGKPKRVRKCYVTLAFSGVPNAKRGEKIRSGCLTPAFEGDHKWAKLLRNSYILRVPQ